MFISYRFNRACKNLLNFQPRFPLYGSLTYTQTHVWNLPPFSIFHHSWNNSVQLLDRQQRLVITMKIWGNQSTIKAETTQLRRHYGNIERTQWIKSIQVQNWKVDFPNAQFFNIL